MKNIESVKTELFVQELTGYANRLHMKVPDTTRDKWRNLLKQGELLSTIRLHIYRYSRKMNLLHSDFEMLRVKRIVQELSELPEEEAELVPVEKEDFPDMSGMYTNSSNIHT